MQKTTDLRGYLAELKKAKDDKKAAFDNFNEVTARYKATFAPRGGHVDKARIRELHALCPDDADYPRSHILVCLVLLLYAPEALYGGKLPMRLAKPTADVLGVKHESVYIARNKVASWLRIYPDFFAVMAAIYDSLEDSA